MSAKTAAMSAFRLATTTLLLAAPLAQAQSIAPGLWQMQHEMNMPGQPDMAAQMAQMREQLKNMPPEMRKMMEQQAGVKMGPGGSVSICLRPEDVREGLVREGREEGGCTFTKISRSGNTWRGQVVCKQPPGTGNFTTVIHNPAHYTTTAQLDSPQHGQMTMKTEARRVAADCGGRRPIKPTK